MSASRSIKDAMLVANVVLPNAANTTCTAALDLGSNDPYPITEKLVVRLITTQSTGANSKNINVRLQDSNESNANFTNQTGSPVITIAGNAANFPASDANIQLPPNTKRYVQAIATGEANGGNAADGTLSLQLRF